MLPNELFFLRAELKSFITNINKELLLSILFLIESIYFFLFLFIDGSS